MITAISAGLSFSSFSIRDNLQYAIPVVVLMATSLLAIIFAVFSAMPKLSTNSVDEDGATKSKASLLFFGNFLQLSKEDFVTHLRGLKKDQEVLYDDLSRDLYNLGGVLEHKYRLLTYSYRIFAGGLVLSFISFLISFQLFSSAA